MDGKTAVERGFADALFDKEIKSMGILSKLFPGNDEVAKLEAAISEAETLRADLVSAQSRISELAPLAEANATLQAELSKLQDELTDAGKSAAETAEKVTALESEVLAVDEKASIKAAELLAQQGHPAPVALLEDEAKTIREQYTALKSPSERNEFRAKHWEELMNSKS